MAIQTIKATMQMRYGLEEDLEPDQLATGEWAVSTDTKKIWMCFAPGLVRRMATYEAFEQDMVEIQTILATCQDIQTAVEAFEQLAEQHKNDAASSALLSESWAHGETGIREGESEDNSKYWSEQSKSDADRAKEEADRAEAIVGLEIDSSLSETSINPVQNRVVTEALNKKLNKDSVINNLSTTQAGNGALDAYQGKVMKDLYNTLAMGVDELNKNLSAVLSLKNVNVGPSSSIVMRRYGHIVVLDFYDIAPASYPSGQDVVIAEGIPKPIWYTTAMLYSVVKNNSGGLRVGISSNSTNLVYWWNSSSLDLNVKYSGQMIYFTND